MKFEASNTNVMTLPLKGIVYTGLMEGLIHKNLNVIKSLSGIHLCKVENEPFCKFFIYNTRIDH